MSDPVFTPKTVYVTYIAAAPDKVWAALITPDFTRQYFFGRTIELEEKVGGRFVLRMADGRVDVAGRVVDYDPPRRLSVTWRVEWNETMRKLPECLVSYDIETMEGAVRLTLTEAYSWDVPDDLLAGGRMGWPLILSSLKSLLETGKPIVVKLEPPKEMIEAVKRAVGEKE
jgi:uncharacterized protein YndB with AHSA1/START domain